mgnify:CR=1 FL=1|jgi:branched-subunit amino acid ABC-type transport system permease component
MIEFINFYLIPGIVLGGIYALGAIGVSMLFGIMRFAHFAHGDFLTLGAYIALPLVTYVGLHPILGAIGSALVVAVIAMSIDQICYKPLRLRSTIVLVMASLGVALMLRSVIQLTFGVEIFSYNPGVIIKPMQFDWLLIKSKDIWIIVASIILMFTIHCLLSYTKVGKAMRAMSDSVELAKLTGIPTEKIVKITWAVGGGLAAIAGVFLAWKTQLQTMLGWEVLLPIFAATILGGIGRPYGAMVGGLVIGLAEELSSYPWIGDEPLLSPGYKTGVAFALMIIMLILRPQGIFKGRVF